MKEKIINILLIQKKIRRKKKTQNNWDKLKTNTKMEILN